MLIIYWSTYNLQQKMVYVSYRVPELNQIMRASHYDY